MKSTPSKIFFVPDYFHFLSNDILAVGNENSVATQAGNLSAGGRAIPLYAYTTGHVGVIRVSLYKFISLILLKGIGLHL